MYGNQIVNGLKRSLKNRKRDWKTPQYRNQVNAAIQSIRQAPHYFLGSYATFEERLKDELGGRKLFKGDLGDIIMPFPEIVILFHLNNEREELKFGVIVKQYSNDMISIQNMMAEKRDWMLFPIVRMYSVGKSLENVGFFTGEPEKLNEAPKDTNLAVSTSVPATLSDDYVFGKGKHLVQAGCGVANYLLIVLGYKNIVTEIVTQDRPSPMKKKKVNPLYEYKILKLRPPGKSKKYRYLQPLMDSKGLVPFTRVPSHKKTYYDSAPMFGNPKLVGTWIIPSYVKGSKQAGFITRDYDVTERV